MPKSEVLRRAMWRVSEHPSSLMMCCGRCLGPSGPSGDHFLPDACNQITCEQLVNSEVAGSSGGSSRYPVPDIMPCIFLCIAREAPISSDQVEHRQMTFNHIFLADMSGYAAMNEVYREYFPENPPARYCIRADLVRPEFLVEIASIAHLDG